MEGSVWFRRAIRESREISRDIHFRRIKFGFYRIYWKHAYIGECYKDMPLMGYDIEEDDVRLMNRSYYEEYEDSAKMTRQLKNFVEGYVQVMDKIRTGIYQIRHSSEHRENAKKAYQQFYIK